MTHLAPDLATAPIVCSDCRSWSALREALAVATEPSGARPPIGGAG